MPDILTPEQREIVDSASSILVNTGYGKAGIMLCGVLEQDNELRNGHLPAGDGRLGGRARE